MHILAFDTAMAACSVAALSVDDGSVRVLGHHIEARPRGHAEVLNGVIDKVMSDAGLSFDQLQRIAVTIGPGTFTGVRVGVAAARGMALALALPCVGVTTLEALAFGAADYLNSDLNIGVASDARRGEVYAQGFSSGLEPLSKPAALSPERAIELFVSLDCTVIGTGAEILAAADGHSKLRVEARAPQQPDALNVARIAAIRALTDMPPEPLYLRAPDAKLPAVKV